MDKYFYKKSEDDYVVHSRNDGEPPSQVSPVWCHRNGIGKKWKKKATNYVPPHNYEIVPPPMRKKIRTGKS